MSRSVRNLEVSGHVGFDSLPDQLVNKAVQKGFIFNILSIGETGIGKSTLMDSLFNTTFDGAPNSSPHTVTSVRLNSETYDLQESNVQIKLTLVDTVGYGDQVNKDDSFKTIVDYVDDQFEAYLQEELQINRCLPAYHDTRIHACLYFICPTGQALKSIDLICMKMLDCKVNIIPLIAKADTLSKSELLKFKEKIASELDAAGVKMYQFPTDDESVSAINTTMNTYLPFAVVGSRDFVQVGSKMVRARKYPWGTVQVENDTHCDFSKLREMLIRTNMEDMQESTHGNHYELYRKARLLQMGFSDAIDSDNKPLGYLQTFQNKIMFHEEELASKQEEIHYEIMQRFQEKESELNEAERELDSTFDRIRDENARDKKLLEDKHKELDDEIAEFHRLKAQHQAAKLSASHRTLSLGRLGLGKKKSGDGYFNEHF